MFGKSKADVEQRRGNTSGSRGHCKPRWFFDLNERWGSFSGRRNLQQCEWWRN